MPYIGTQPLTGEFIKLDSITAGSTSPGNEYPLTRGGAAFFPASATQIIVSVDGVTQAPIDAYTVNTNSSGNPVIVFTENLSSSDTIDYILALGEIGNSIVPTDGSVTSAKLSATLGRGTAPIRVNTNSLTTNQTIASGENAGVFGPFTIPTSVTLTVNGTFTVV